ncbi:MAG: right-handed parallel beta-helix repeat-containing protein [Asgard group archaeon]|nr:right-handed parallel beta-helix repeat-containing protein [Asgard group archaeon]
MVGKKFKITFVMMMIFWLCCNLTIMFTHRIEANEITHNPISIRKYESKIILDNLTEHDPIYIDSNDDFETYNCTGEGTEIEPYLIKNLNITAIGYISGIEITLTTAYFEIKNCLILSDFVGIKLEQVAADTAKIIENICISSEEDGGGIALQSTNGCNITNNECANFIQGVHLNYASSNIIYGNIILDNHYQGINIRYSNLNTIIYNSIENSEQHGIALVGSSSNNVIHHNNIINNSKVEFYTIDGDTTGAICSQGYDEGTNNIWYDEFGRYGNIWSDYGGIGTYAIDGSAESEDIYPIELTSNESDTLIIFNIPLTIICVGLLITLIKRRRK